MDSLNPSVGVQLPGGPFVQVGDMQSHVWWSFTTPAKDDERTVSSSTQHYHTDPESMLAAADCMAEIAGALRTKAQLALDFRAQLREVTF